MNRLIRWKAKGTLTSIEKLLANEEMYVALGSDGRGKLKEAHYELTKLLQRDDR